MATMATQPVRLQDIVLEGADQAVGVSPIESDIADV
jgi:hypothetical protein